MPKKEKPAKKSAKSPSPTKKTKKPKEAKAAAGPAPTAKAEEQAPAVEEVAKEKTKRDRAHLSVLQAAVLETIRERAQRPRAIQTIIHSAGGVDIPRNEVIRSLNELKDKGLVEKTTAKAWRAK